VPEPASGRPGEEEGDRPPSGPAAAPGSSGPGQPGYAGEATVGDEGAAAGPEAYGDPFGRPDS
jgi:hypothetical protein